MTTHRSRIVLVAAAVAAVAAVTTPVAASAHDGGHDGGHDGDNLVRASVVPSLPTDAPIFGVKAGGAPWVLGRGEVRVREDGRTDVRLRGLQIPRADGTRDNPVAMITASLYCDGMLAARSSAQPMSVPGGDARFRVWLAVPETCPMATVLINPAANPAVYIASATANDS
jgi:hypothetical protein